MLKYWELQFLNLFKKHVCFDIFPHIHMSNVVYLMGEKKPQLCVSH